MVKWGEQIERLENEDYSRKSKKESTIKMELNIAKRNALEAKEAYIRAITNKDIGEALRLKNEVDMTNVIVTVLAWVLGNEKNRKTWL